MRLHSESAPRRRQVASGVHLVYSLQIYSVGESVSCAQSAATRFIITTGFRYTVLYKTCVLLLWCHHNHKRQLVEYILASVINARVAVYIASASYVSRNVGSLSSVADVIYSQ